MKYKCDWCQKEFEMTINQIKNYKKDPNKKYFCCLSCSGKYYAKKSHEGKSIEEEQKRREKISKTLKTKEMYLSEEQKRKRTEKLNNYWKYLDKEARSIRNKKNAIKSKQT